MGKKETQVSKESKMKERTTIIGVFEDRIKAQQAINELKRAGFNENQIGMTARDNDRVTAENASDEDSYAGEGAMAGLATGAGVGALWGLGIVAGLLPAIGPAIAGGTLAAILSSAAAGAAAAGLAGTLIGLGIPKEEAEFYESEMEAGRVIVTVKADGRQSEAMAIMRRFGAYDMSTRPQHSALESSGSSARAGTTRTASGDRTIQAREEELHVRKQPVRAGEVEVRKETHTEHKQIDVPVQREEVVVERHPVSGKAASGPVGGNETIRVPVTEEQVQVEKQPVVKEEIKIGKRTIQGKEQVEETVRKEDIKIEKRGNPDVRNR
jgi:uncharacterized protein (TIGR02271 family)